MDPLTRRTQGAEVLWVDDDGPDRFMYEEYLLGRKGWVIRWACDVVTAACYLKDSRFSIVIIDQMLPIQVQGELSEWGGYHLLAWLRGAGGQHHPEAPGLPLELHQFGTLADNRSVPVIIVSAFSDETIEDATRRLPCQASTAAIPKPIDISRLMRSVEGLK